MRISYRAAGGTGAFVAFADEAVGVSTADRISGFQPQLRKSPQIEPLAFSDEIFVADRGNSQWTLTFNVARQHVDAPDALRFLSEHPASINAIGTVDLKIEQGTQINYMLACALAEFSPDPHSDRSTFCRYTFVGGNFQTTSAS